MSNISSSHICLLCPMVQLAAAEVADVNVVDEEDNEGIRDHYATIPLFFLSLIPMSHMPLWMEVSY